MATTIPRGVAGASSCVLLLLSTTTSANLTLNEILYDPDGPDGDSEYVEIHNSATTEISLENVELVFVNGADPSSPRVLWTGGVNDRVPPGGWFLVAEAAVEGADAVTDLSLQNGPDALWLRRGPELLDRVAWGDVEGLGEGAPAEDVSGRSLGRVPDGADSDENSLDLRGLEATTPGGENLAAVRWELDRLELEPPWLPRPGPLVARVELRAAGWAPTQSARIQVAGSREGPRPLSLSVGESRALSWTIDVDAETDSVLVLVESSGASRRFGRTLRVGPGDVILSEVMARPASGRPEWIELHNRGSEDVDLSGWAFSDADRRPRAIGEGVGLPARGFLLLAAEAESMGPTGSAPVLRPEGGWPALNQSDGEEGFADELLLFDADGRAVDHLRWKADRLTEAGRSLERARVSAATPAVWIEAPRGSSPGRVNDSARQPLPAVGLQARPNPFSPDGDGREDFLHVALRDDSLAATVEAEIFDLAGDRVRRLRAAGSDEIRQWIWDGRDERGERVPAGAYVLLLRPTVPAGRTWRELVAVGYRR